MVASASSPLTVHDLEGMPADGRRYELVDGVLVVTPAPGWPHQEMAGALYVLLRQLCPPDLRVLMAPFAVGPNKYTELQPDLLVARYDDLTLTDLPVAPVLAVEVLSRSIRLIDLNLKRAAFGGLGVPSFWLLDPAPRAPSITALELADDGEYRQVGWAVGDDEFVTERPLAVRLRPADLLAGLQRR
ncbi:MAG TPA: Uma2 family endonuclease [Pseudonocardiaceae bacterium]